MSEENGGFVAYEPMKDHEEAEDIQFFILGPNKQPQAANLGEWMSESMNGAGLLAEDDVEDIQITTQFIGFDVGDDPANPKMFESFVLGQHGKQVLDMRKLAATYDEAMANHAQGLEVVKRILSQ